MITALFAATIAVAQNDIKKVLAYSTVSASSATCSSPSAPGAYVAAIFHMITHAFFKALLFLGSGSVIHGMHDEQDMRKMGGLRKLMPITAVTFIVGWLAIAGVPPFAGFWSKDEILLFALAKSPALYVLGLVTALLTALLHDPPGDHGVLRQGQVGGPRRRSTARTASSSRTSRPPIMLVPLVVLAVLSIVGGLIQLPPSRGSPTMASTARAAGWSRWSSSARPTSSGTWADDHLVPADGHRHRRRRSPASSSPTSSTRRHRIKAIEPEILANGWYYDQAVTEFMGGPGPRGVRGRRLVRPQRHRRRRQRRRRRRARRPPASCARARAGYVRAYAAIIGVGVVAAARPGSSSSGGSL